mmetsp:Transcript_39226/g.77180  ORF Transcript_39226/g.77180 Transcript_39226/m.77180 type:complete len:83 (-) Transcript_39226:201-449(-)
MPSFFPSCIPPSMMHRTPPIHPSFHPCMHGWKQPIVVGRANLPDSIVGRLKKRMEHQKHNSQANACITQQKSTTKDIVCRYT